MKASKFFSVCAGALVTAALAGCDNRGNSTASYSATNAPGTNAAVAADNTARNQADQSSNNLTPLDQGKSDADMAVTKQIRKALVRGGGNFSVMAKNIKIITVDGNVTLRGPVASEAERTEIEGLAKSAAGAGTVNNQLEVKSNQQVNTQ